MFLKLDVLQELHEQWSNSTLEELNALMDGFTNELTELQEPITDEVKDAIQGFIQNVPMNSGFGVSSSIVAIFKKVSAHHPEETQTTLTSMEYRVLQKVIVDSKPTNITQMIAVDNILKATQHIAVKVGTLEQKCQMISPIIVKKETEALTGLQYSAEDNLNTSPNESNVPASMHVVKDSDKLVAKKRPAKAKAKKETV